MSHHTITYDDLEVAYREGKATMPVDHINHRELILDGTRYYAGWESTLDPRTGKVWGWIVYKYEKE